MKACLFTLCESSLAALPDKGKSEFVRKAILAFCPASPSKGETAAVKPYNPAEWKRENGFPSMPKHDAYKVTDMMWRDGVCINSPPLHAFAGLSAYDGAIWFEFVRQWRMVWRDPWPSLREWEAMGKPRKPSEGHRVSVPAVEPLPDVVPAVAVASPLQGGGVSSNVLDDI